MRPNGAICITTVLLLLLAIQRQRTQLFGFILMTERWLNEHNRLLLFSATFCAQLTSNPLPNFPSILALQTVEIVRPKSDQQLFFFFAPLFVGLPPLLFRSRSWNGIRRVVRVARARRLLGLARNICTRWRASGITEWQVALRCSLFGA